MPSQTESGAFVGGLMIGTIIGVIVSMPMMLGAMGSTSMGVLQHQQTAIDAGHAEWIVDQETGERAFKWKSGTEIGDWIEEEAPEDVASPAEPTYGLLIGGTGPQYMTWLRNFKNESGLALLNIREDVEIMDGGYRSEFIPGLFIWERGVGVRRIYDPTDFEEDEDLETMPGKVVLRFDEFYGSGGVTLLVINPNQGGTVPVGTMSKLYLGNGLHPGNGLLELP